MRIGDLQDGVQQVAGVVVALEQRVVAEPLERQGNERGPGDVLADQQA